MRRLVLVALTTMLWVLSIKLAETLLPSSEVFLLLYAIVATFGVVMTIWWAIANCTGRDNEQENKRKE